MVGRVSMAQSDPAPETPVLLFDGTCVLCNHTVQFILKNESETRLHFASLQSDLGQRLLREHRVPTQLDSMVLVEHDGAHAKSEAVWRIAQWLQPPWQCLPPKLLTADTKLESDTKPESDSVASRLPRVWGPVIIPISFFVFAYKIALGVEEVGGRLLCFRIFPIALW